MFWAAECDPSVIVVDASSTSARDENAFNLETLPVIATVVRGNGGTEQVLLGSGRCSIRLSITSGTMLLGPVRLRLALPALADLEPRLSALRLLARLQAGMLPLPPPPVRQRTERPALILRTLDALAEGASLRGVATALFGAARVAEDWNRRSDYLKSRVRRLVGQARALAAGRLYFASSAVSPLERAGAISPWPDVA